MSKLLSRLPVELFTVVFGQLPLCSLTSISLVCKTCQVAAFPCLYQTMRLSDVAHLEVLEERLLADDTPDSLSVPIHLQCLKLSGRIRYRDVHYFDNILPKLTRLRCLYWELEFMPKNFRWFSACLGLKSVHLLPRIPEDTVDMWMERHHQLLRFTNLTHFSLQSNVLPRGFNEDDDQRIEPLTALLRSSPDLESIVLNIEGAHRPYSPTLILERLGSQFVFPQLHTFHVLGDADPGWSKFISTATHPLRAFLARHPTIQDFGIGYSMEVVSRTGMDPDELSRLLPSVKHLACPMFVCEVVVISKLATQLESLAMIISNTSLGEPRATPFDLLLEVMTEDSLPNLRKLAIWDDFSSYSLSAEALESFFLAAKGLEELEFRLDVDDYDEFLSVLSGAKNLRRIKLDQERMCDSTPTGIWESVMVELAEACPLLETIVDYHGIDSWGVIRHGTDQPTIVEIKNRSL